MIPLKKTKIYTVSVLAGALTNIILNVLLIKKYGAIGAAIATRVAEFIVLSIQLYEINKNIKIKEIVIESKNYMLSAIVMFICVNLLRITNLSGIKLIIVQVILGVIVYILSLVLLKDSTINKVIEIVKEKYKKVVRS